MKLFRPVGAIEMELIIDSDMKRFPQRLFWQPIFYPVMTFQYAAEIAERWNVQDDQNGNIGFVTAFEIDDKYVSNFEIQCVGAEHHLELWIPAEELENFNDHIIGRITVEKHFCKPDYEPSNKLKRLFVD